MKNGNIKNPLLFILVIGGFFVSGCTKDNSNPSAPGQIANTPETPSEIQIDSDTTPITVASGPLGKMGCSLKGDLEPKCIKKFAQNKSGRSPMWTSSGFSKYARGPWRLRQMYRVRPDNTFRKMRGINHDMSKAGPMLVWRDYAEFQGWGDEDYVYSTRDIRKTRDGAVRFEFQRRTLFTIDNLNLECFIPTLLEGKKLLCVWYHQNFHTGRDDFRGYIEFDRKHGRP